MNPSLRNLFMNTLTRDRVVPTISASVFDPQQRWPERVMMVFGFVGIAGIAFAAGGWPAPR
jgi:hypothetical protein